MKCFVNFFFVVVFLLFNIEVSSDSGSNSGISESGNLFNFSLVLNSAAAVRNEEEEEEEDEEDIEHIDIIGTPPDDWDWDDGDWDDWGWDDEDDECSNISLCGGDDGDGAGGGPTESQEVCLARAEVAYFSCKEPVYRDHLDAMSNICPYFLDVEVGARIIFGSVTVRSYDSCVNTADSMRERFLNGCDINRAMHRLQCIK